MASTRRRPSALLRVYAMLCALLPGLVQGAIPGHGTDSLTGEASVVIFENFETGQHELRYYLVDEISRAEQEISFAGAPPAAFRTGNIVTLEGHMEGAAFHAAEAHLLESAMTPPAPGQEAAVAPPETRNVLTLLVDFNDAWVDGPGMLYGVDPQEAGDRMFNEPRSVAGLYFNASLGTLTIPPDPDGDSVEDVFGPYTIDASYLGGDPAQCTPSTWVDLASAAWEAANPGKDINLYRHRLLIVPNYQDWTNRHCSWGGVAQVGCGAWCWAIGSDPDTVFHGVLIHELGHNLGLEHARTDPDNDGFAESEYGDHSDMMGGSRNWMKFNAPHAEDMGWTDPVEYEIRTVAPAAAVQAFDLLAMDEEVWDWPGLRAIKVPRTGDSDYFISYRLSAGEYNWISAAYRHRINIHYSPHGSNASYYVTKLANGETYNDPHNDLVISATGELTVSGPAGSTTVMGVEICQAPCAFVEAPSNLAASPVASDAIDLAWDDNSDNEDGFEIEHSTDGSSWAPLAATGSNVSTYTHTGLAPASEHHYRVRAYNTGAVSDWSAPASATTPAIPPVADFTWSAQFTDVTFADLSSDPDGSLVAWAWDFGDGGTASTAHPQHSYAEGGTYSVGLLVTDNHGATDFTSRLVTVEDLPVGDYLAVGETTPGGTPTGGFALTHADDGNAQSILERVSGGKKSSRYSWLEHQWTFNIPAGDAATVFVNAWQDASGDGDSFDFEYSADGTNWVPMFNVSATSDPGIAIAYELPDGISGDLFLRVTDTDRTAGNSLLDPVHVDALHVRVVNPDVEPPDGAPANLAASAVSPVQVYLSWEDGSSNESGFRVECREIPADAPPGPFTEVGQAGANDDAIAEYTDSNELLEGGKTYEYRVVAFNPAGERGPSNEDQVTTPEPADIELVATAGKLKGKHATDLSWTDEPPIEVQVYRDGVLVASNVAGGAYTDATGNRGAASYDYQVCNSADPGSCSHVVTVVY